MVVTPAWLASHLDDPNLVLIHVGDSADYAKNHIAGARFANLSRLSAPTGDGRLTLEMPPAGELRNGLAELGISDRSSRSWSTRSMSEAESEDPASR